MQRVGTEEKGPTWERAEERTDCFRGEAEQRIMRETE